ncbi:MAG: nitroreductase [Atopobiaceae bacterium]|nr:nitroreductase [Atopobiaceae bacterium]
MNETIQTLKIRRSVRSFTDKPVDRALIEQIIDAGLWAASGMGKQAPIVLAITNKELRDRLSHMNADIMRATGRGPARDFDPFYGGPVVLVVLADKSVPTHVYDGALVMGNLMNAAASLGVDSIWIHRAKEEFDSEEGKAILAEAGIEGDYEGIGHCVLGYAATPAGEGAARRDGRVFWVE